MGRLTKSLPKNMTHATNLDMNSTSIPNNISDLPMSMQITRERPQLESKHLKE